MPLFTMELLQCGCHGTVIVIEAADRPEALRILKEKKPDLVQKGEHLLQKAPSNFLHIRVDYD